MRKSAKMRARMLGTKSQFSTSHIHKTAPSQPVHAVANDIVPLQRTIGNRAVQRLVKSGTIGTKLPGGQIERILHLRRPAVGKKAGSYRPQTELLASQNSSLIQPQNGDAVEARKQRGQQLAKDIIGAMGIIREVYLKRYGSWNPMAIVVRNTINRRKGPWDQYLTIDDVKQNYGKRDVTVVSYMEKTLIGTTRYGLVHGWTFMQIAESWEKIWTEAVQAVAYVRKGLQQWDSNYKPMVKWMLGRRYKNSVLSYLVRPDPGFWKKMWLWLTSQSS